MKLPTILAELRQFCFRSGLDGKRPYTRRGNKPNPQWEEQDTWMTMADAQNVAASGVPVRIEKDGAYTDCPIAGIGFLCAKADDPVKQIVGGDIDACRDPETGKLSDWATQFLEDTQPFYVEVSPSRCGIRMFYLGHLPTKKDNFLGNGAQDIDEETQIRIKAIKPNVQKKLDKGEMPWNALELYESGKHLSLTGIDSKNYDIEDRSAKLAIALLPLMAAKSKPACLPESGWIAEMREASENRLPKLSIMQVIDTTGWERSGDQLRGPHPILGSTTGVNTVVNPAQNNYCWMHCHPPAGGDAWVWLAHECGAAPWEASGEGLLRDPVIKARTIEYAISKGLVKKEDFSERALQVNLKLEDVAIEIGEGDAKRWKYSQTTASNSILKTLKLAMSKTCAEIFYFNGKIFIPDGERIINNMLVEAGGDLATIKNKKETIAILHDKILNYPVVFDPDPYLLGVMNGVVDLRTGDFRDYHPKDLITDQIPVEYNKEAKCPQFIQFIKDIAPNEIDQAMLVDWFAIHAIKLMFPYVMFLNGLGRNGKGVYERMLRRFYGEHAFSHIPLEELNSKTNRFAGNALKNKRGQIVSEAGEITKEGKRTIPTNYLKNVSGDGIIDTDQKNLRDRNIFKPYCKATIDSNDMPTIEDNSRGWAERFCKADMPFHYVDDPDPSNPLERKKDPELFEKLSAENELSGILNLIIERTTIICKTMTITRRSGQEMFAEYQKQSSSINTFLEMFCDFDSMGNSKLDMPIDTIYEYYGKWCDFVVCDKVKIDRFGRSVKKMCGGREAERLYVVDEHGNNKKKRIYKGFRFDINRYQDHLDHLQTTRRPLKTDTAPLGPLECIYHVSREESKVIECIEKNFPENCSSGADSDSKNSSGADSGASGPESRSSGPNSDFVEVVFKTDYRTDIDGKMQNVKQGEILKVSASRAQAWQMRGVVEIVNRQQA